MVEPTTSQLVWTFIMSGCTLLFIICMLVYFKAKQKEFLYYGLYNIVLLSYIAIKNPFTKETTYFKFFKDYFQNYNEYSQVVYIYFLFLFYMYFIDLHKNYSKSFTLIKRFLSILLIIYTLLFIVTSINSDRGTFFYAFHFAYIPMIIIVTIILVVLLFSKKSNNELGYFSVSGIFLYNFFAYMALYKSYYTNAESPIVYFYYGIALESLVFIIGLSYKVNLIYEDKSKAQKKIIQEQKKLNLIQENYQRDLERKIAERENELQESQQIAEQNKIEVIKKDYLAQLKTLHLSSLQSQMNPHFIFNALNSIKVYLIENKQNEAIFYLNKFSKLIRKILESSRTEYHSLEEELRIIKLYTSIENIRFDNDIIFTIKRKREEFFDDIKVPTLFLQPFIENAIWHGLAFKETEREITVELIKMDSGVELSVTDNGIGRKAAQEIRNKKTFKRESVGLKMTMDRFKLFNQKYDYDYSFVFEDLLDESENSAGTRVIFVLKTH